MNEDIRGNIESLPREEFREHREGLRNLSPTERLRWLQQTALFVWRYRGVANDLERASSKGSG